MAAVCPRVKLPAWVFEIVRSGWSMFVRSLSLLLTMLTSPPPDTVTLLVTLAGALLATVTVKVIVELLPAAREVDRVQVSVAGPVAGSVAQLQFVPLIAVAVRPAGSVSVTVIVPLVAVPPLLVTTTLYVAPV